MSKKKKNWQKKTIVSVLIASDILFHKEIIHNWDYQQYMNLSTIQL